ncbi:hydantoinase/oxoprolinase N-terminal domain-containing protein [Actinoplanes sp. L3-i22]|uniref:hydantoinase/oxoprolinase N-terminal domain-containing protein n=1 Tax=Actinoplanes sp. L3-i22 TaxID=2836373 RepID=UPI001C78C111|nr:hydantoinase/oxoprolinase family protein [Actinoplanes sp. L3-i22]BCY11620.1 hydantoinase subunit beta [Actinoplanes sp. L3-i22]
MSPKTVIGVDVGGTNTDAVALDAAGRVLAAVKRPTTEDVTGGVRAALDALGEHVTRASRIVVGSTHATNAVVQRRGLGRVAVLRLGAPSGASVPPFTGWPADLRASVDGGVAHVRGGVLLDGRPLTPLDEDAIDRFLDKVADGGGVDAVAVTGVFATSDGSQENAVRERVLIRCGPEVPVSLSHEIGGPGLLERENATILNAALAQVVRMLTAAVDGHHPGIPCYLAQNDGTVMDAAHAARFPVLTIGSGQANSVRGAAILAGIGDAIVADIGGTTTDLCVLTGGQPRQSTVGVTIGGIRLAVPMPDVLSVPIGGGTIVHGTAAEPRLGPRSVAHAITSQALVFGGGTPTLTDVARHAGRTGIGHTTPGRRFHDLLRGALPLLDARLAEAVDVIGGGRGRLPLVLVGGGAPIADPAGEVIRPEHAGVAAAVGAATAEAGGRAEAVVPLGVRHGPAMAAAERQAVARAVAAGADPARVRVTEVTETPLSYLSTPAVRLRVKAAGPLVG